VADTRTTSGVAGLDALIGGGFPANRAILLYGQPGTGKTTFGLQFLEEGIRRGEPGVYLTVDEKPEHLLEDAAALGWDLQDAVKKGTLAMLDADAYFTVTRSHTSVPVDARLIAGDLTQQIRKIKARRLVIDPFTSLVPPGATRWTTYDYLRSLIHSLEGNLGCTVLMTSRPPSQNDLQGACEAAETLSSGIVDLQLVKQYGKPATRTLFVQKMRGTRVDLVEHEFSIEPRRGLSLLTPTAPAPGQRFLRDPDTSQVR